MICVKIIPVVNHTLGKEEKVQYNFNFLSSPETCWSGHTRNVHPEQENFLHEKIIVNMRPVIFVIFVIMSSVIHKISVKIIFLYFWNEAKSR